MTEGASSKLRGAAAGLTAAALFGLSAPIAKRLVEDGDPQVIAGLLYAGAAIGFWAYRAVGKPVREAPLRRADLPAAAAVALLGGVVGPVLLLVGLQRVSAVAGSLLLNLEAPATILLAALFFKEHLGRRLALAAAFIVVGASVLGYRPGSVAADPLGVAAIGLACVAWAIDNNLTQRLSLKDPFAIVRLKATSAAIANIGVSILRGVAWPPADILALTLVVGLASYGLSVLLDAYALRLVGAAREAAYFATGPFVGAVAAAVFFHESFAPADFAGAAAMMAGVGLLLRERHAHRHRHEPLEHEHAHVHDDHHRHGHEPGHPPGEPHVHLHRHEALEHEHEHLPDEHHRHSH